MNEALELLRQYRAILKGKGKLRQAHTINNAIQYLQRKQKESNEQRVHHPEPVHISEHEGEALRAHHPDVPPEHGADRAAGKLQKPAAANDAAERRARAQAFYQKRNAEIVRRIKAGEKRYTLAMEFGMSPNTVTVIARNAGIPAFRRYNVRNTTKELT